jgi:hypothetical protein
MTRWIDREGKESVYKNGHFVFTGKTFTKELREGVETWLDTDPVPKPRPITQSPKPQKRLVKETRMSRKFHFPSREEDALRKYAAANIDDTVLQESRKLLMNNRKRRHHVEPDPAFETLKSYGHSAELKESVKQHEKRRAELPHRPDNDLYESDNQLWESKRTEHIAEIAKKNRAELDFRVEPKLGPKQVGPSTGKFEPLYPAKFL